MSARLASSFSQKVIISVSIMVEFKGRLFLIVNEVRSDLPNKRLSFQKSNRASQEKKWNWQMSISSITDYSCTVGMKQFIGWPNSKRFLRLVARFTSNAGPLKELRVL